MTIVAPDSGELKLLEYIVSAGSKILKLYSNDITPSDATVVGDLTEVGVSGYAAATLASVNWTTTQVAGVSSAVYSEQTYTFNTGVSLYGYYVTDTSNNLLWLERFDGAPREVPADGGTFSLTAKLSLA